MAIYLRIRKIHETPTQVEYVVADAVGTTDLSLVVDKEAVETQLETLTNPKLRRALTMIATYQIRTGQWPAKLVKQS